MLADSAEGLKIQDLDATLEKVSEEEEKDFHEKVSPFAAGWFLVLLIKHQALAPCLLILGTSYLQAKVMSHRRRILRLGCCAPPYPPGGGG